MDSPFKLNIGGATGPQLDGYTVIDRKTGGNACPLWLDEKPIADNSADEIRASHVLEHFSYHRTLDVVKEWARAMKPGGVLKIAVPDFDKIVDVYQASNTEWPIEGYIMGGHIDADDHHGAIFNEPKLRTLMELAGLTDIRPWPSDAADCSSLPVSLNLQGKKPVPGQAKPMAAMSVSGILSMPRLDFTDASDIAVATALSLRINVRKRIGVYWHSTLTMGIEESLREDNPKYILAIDSDTIYTPNDVCELYRLMEANPQAAAIFGLQMGRDRNMPIMSIRDESGGNKGRVLREEVARELLPVSTGHFGLCLIRVSDLLELPKPWFLAVPGADGSWGEGRVDADIYFWRLMERCGKKIYQANRVVLGHLQMVVTYPDKEFGAIHQYIADWRKTGKPAEAWV